MGGLPRRAARALGFGSAAALAAYSVVTLVGMSGAVLAAGCKGSPPRTFLAITQSSASASASSAITFTVTVENEGPCNVSGATFTDLFTAVGTGASVQVSVASTNPSSDASTCSPLPPASVSGASVTITCGPLNKISSPNDANQTNPGTAVFTISVIPSGTTTSVTSRAHIDYAGEIANDVGYTTSFGGFLVSGGDIFYPPSPGDLEQQSTDLAVGAGHGAAEIEQVDLSTQPTCPTGVKCFGSVVLINASNILNGTSPAIQTYTFTLVVPKGGPQSASQVAVLHIADTGSTWQTVLPCTAVPPAPTAPSPDPCVGSIVKFKNSAGVSFFTITVYTENNGRWIV